MAQQRLGIIMNGVTGRMGINQHLIRSIWRSATQGGVALKNGDRVMPDPILVGRNAEKLERLAKAHGIARWTTDLDAALEEQGRHGVLRCRHDPDARRAAEAGDRRRQGHLLREAGARQARRCARSSRSGEAGRHQARRGAGQAVPAGPAEDQDAARCRVLRPHPVGARRVRLLGVRGRLAAGAAAELELQEGRRRRHHPRHAVPLALRARQPVRRGEERFVPRRDAHSRSAGTRTASPTRPTRTTRPTRPSSSRAA